MTSDQLGFACLAFLCGCAAAAPRSETLAPAPAPAMAMASSVPTALPPADEVAMLAEISPERLTTTVARLAAFGTRHTLSDPESPTRGIGAARRFIAAEMERAGPPLRVSMESHHLTPDGRRIPREVDLVNVVAVLPGTLPEAAGRRYYVVGHYDSRASDALDATSDAPGANDDASGASVVMELARVMSHHRYDATLVFLATAGEEQGLLGARSHVETARGEKADIRGVLNNDIVGDPSPSPPADRRRVRVFSEGGAEDAAPSRELARFVAGVAAWHGLPVQPMLVLRRDRFGRGGDQTPFLEAGFPAVRLTVVDETYDRQHQNVRSEGGHNFGDLPKFVDGEYLAGVARVNAAALAHLANAPSVPGEVRLLTGAAGGGGLATDTRLRWTASPEPDVAGYEVLWRETTSVMWQHSRDVGAVTETTLPLNKDNFFFGVRAYDRTGHRSPAAPATAPPRGNQPPPG